MIEQARKETIQKFRYRHNPNNRTPLVCGKISVAVETVQIANFDTISVGHWDANHNIACWLINNWRNIGLWQKEIRLIEDSLKGTDQWHEIDIARLLIEEINSLDNALQLQTSFDEYGCDVRFFFM